MAKANIALAMEMLDPERCAQAYELPNIMQRDRYPPGPDRVETFDELLQIAREYYQYHFAGVVGGGGIAPERVHADGMAWEILDHHYQGGREAAYMAAVHGMNGGLPGILDAIRDYFLKQQETQYFNHVIMEVVDVMDLDDIKALMSQYLQRYGRHIGGGHMPSAEYLVPKYREIIKAHADIVRNIRMQYGR